MTHKVSPPHVATVRELPLKSDISLKEHINSKYINICHDFIQFYGLVVLTAAAVMWGFECTGPKLGVKIFGTVLSTVTLQDMDGLQTHRLLHPQGRETHINDALMTL